MRRAPPRAAAVMLWVALGAIPGALLRWWLANLLVANTLGCFVLGVSGLLGPSPSNRRRLLLGMGFAGTLTSFSSWVLALETHLGRGHWADLLGQILGEGALGVGALLLGAAAHRRLSDLRAHQLRR